MELRVGKKLKKKEPFKNVCMEDKEDSEGKEMAKRKTVSSSLVKENGLKWKQRLK